MHHKNIVWCIASDSNFMRISNNLNFCKAYFNMFKNIQTIITLILFKV